MAEGVTFRILQLHFLFPCGQLQLLHLVTKACHLSCSPCLAALVLQLKGLDGLGLVFYTMP